MNPGSRMDPLRICIAAVSVFGIICSAAVLFPQIQRLIIQFVEHLIRRKVWSAEDWMHTLAAWARACIALIVLFDFFTLTGPDRRLLEKTGGEMKECLAAIDFKGLGLPFLFMFLVYLAGMAAVIRADFSYVDDIDRAVRGYHGWNGWSRHLADILSTFIHADTNLADISPLPQLLAVLMMAAGSVMLVYVLCGGKITAIGLIAGIPLGLSPYFLENLSYKFDAPYMALSVLASIVPFLFTRARRAFIFSSVLSLLIMCMNYQASSGIYPMITLMLLFNDWNGRRKSNREILAFGLRAAASFCFALVLFRLIFMVSGTTGHGVSTAMLPPHRLIPGILENLGVYASTINEDFGLPWKFGVLAICILFIINAGKTSLQKGGRVFIRAEGLIPRPLGRYKRVLNPNATPYENNIPRPFRARLLIVPLMVTALSFSVSYGAYLALESPLFAPRALYGFGAFIAIISIVLAGSRKKITLISIAALNWCFFVFAFSYGNALADQKRYTNFRVELALHDLAALFPRRTQSDPDIHLENNIGFGPYTENIARHYPLIKKLVPLNRHYHIYKYMNYYFHWAEGVPWEDGFDPSGLPEALDSYYHRIRSDGKHILLTFKN